MTNTTTANAPAKVPPEYSSRRLAAAGRLCVAGGAIAAVGATISATLDSSISPHLLSYPFNPGVFRACELLWTLTHLLTLIGLIGLSRSRLIGESTLATVGRRIAIPAMALMIPAELGFVFVADSSIDATASVALDSAIGASATIAGIGLTLIGIAVLRNRRWTGWGQYTPLCCGAVVLLVLLPVQAIHPAGLEWAIAGWNVCFVLLGAALVGEAGRSRRRS